MANETWKQRLYSVVGWALGLVVSATTPMFTAPLGLVAPFHLGSAVFGMSGFGGMFWYSGRPDVSGGRKLLTALGCAALDIGAYSWYRSLLLAKENASPSLGVEVLEFVLYCVASLLVLAAMSYVYWHVGPKIFDKLFKKFLTGSA